ncbi:hypothetical protein DL240_02005 [Lujinxingia litoralis]|uniref:Uncharacterized protein n=1 Tax=Lujinxingia litoralis TaxID=2211119 RepID=A0A328CDH5_9DELT|nr:hypothetical protein [Lujinxingia litoralis]RAL25009.1 hypothetical protein DL240_02005 [Lujinxingia litoralis]
MLTLLTLQFGCGEGGGGDEVVYFHIYNGYAGSSQMSLYGPSGTLVTGLPFGARTEEPVAFDRSLPGTLTLVLDGSPAPIELPAEAWSLFPHETASLFLIRREGQDALLQLYRHVPSISQNCRAVFGNALSTPSANLGQYNYMVGFELQNISFGGYLSNDPRGADFLNEVAAYPYFFLVQSEDAESEGVLIPVWVGEEGTVDFPRVDFQAGTITADPPTVEVLECVADAQGDPEAEAECYEQKSYQGIVFTPGVESTFIHYAPESFGNNPGTCDVDFRIFSDFSNIFQGQHGSGSFVDGSIRGKSADHLFWVLYGWPYGDPGPQVASWVSSAAPEDGGSVPLPEDYPATP